MNEHCLRREKPGVDVVMIIVTTKNTVNSLQKKKKCSK